jgi:hypothetical protein
MRLEQAIFTSVRSERLDGYQLAARSSDMPDELAQELTAWGPAHDSLWLTEPGATSVNFHPLSHDRWCLSQTTLSGAEYSGRGGGRVYTQMVVLPREAIERFAGDPFLVLRALAASGRITIHEQVPRELPSIPLVGRAAGEPLEWMPELVAKAGVDAMTELTDAAVRNELAAVVTDLPVERLIQAVLHVLAPQQRLEVSFTTGLRPSTRRPFRLSAIPPDPALIRQSPRSHQGKVIEILTADPKKSSSKPTPKQRLRPQA